MFNSRIAIALFSAISSLGRSVYPWEQPAPAIPKDWDFGANRRGRAGTRSNQRYVHKFVQMHQAHRDHTNGIEWVDRWAEANRPKRRAERKGINTVPRAPVNSLHAISF